MFAGGRPSSRGRDRNPGGKRREPEIPRGQITRPYRRQTVGRGSGSGSERKRRSSGHEKEERDGPSQQVLARVAEIREKARRYAREGSFSDSEEEEEEAEGEGVREVVEKLLKKYYQDLGSDGVIDEDVMKTAILAAAGSCLVCLSAMRRTDPVWSCIQCYCQLHLQCIQQWARDGERKQSLLSPELFPDQEIIWSCPKCRLEHPMAEFPKTYYCFCGKHVDPPVDPWLLPHTCGEICGKPLQPECGHTCVSLCHPGPCPPCPKTLSVSCYCGRSHPVVKRCGVRGWRCGRVCGRELSCGLHTCEQQCHDGPCGECEEMIEQCCVCERESQLLPCTAPSWQCTQECGQLLSCGSHTCERVCHSGDCGDCPKSGTRTCPCGKTKHNIPCTEDVPTCKDTCGKELLCGKHKCIQPCHYGPCGQCLQVTMKRCRCGKKEKQVMCSSELVCETKCSRMRQCGRHQCRRKCCDGSCPPCEQICGRSLGCRNHKCAAPCHSGQCYPCILTVEVYCACRVTVKTVPCGLKRMTKPPRCRQLCNKPPACHHTEGTSHYCHYGDCPPCKEVCGKELSCGHFCQARCHSLPTTPAIRPPGVAPWVKIKPVVTPCPPCSFILTKACNGEHEVSEQKCSELREYSCGRQCGRRLRCGNHTCRRGCHVVINPPDNHMAGEDCLECNRGCEVPRPPGCTHSCPRPCHIGPCPVCRVLVKIRCHCDTMNLFVECCDWTSADEETKMKLSTCTSQCTRKLACGHRCPLGCHHGNCPPPETCRRKVTLRCACRRLKKEVKCNEKDSKDLSCDSQCRRLIAEREMEEKKAEEERRLKEEKEKEEEEAALAKQLGPRRRRRRQRRVEEEEDDKTSCFGRYRRLILVGGALGVATMTVTILGYLSNY